MKNPSPVNLQTPSELALRGWAAESRDKDGHLMTTHAPFESTSEREEYCTTELLRGYSVTLYATPKGET